MTPIAELDVEEIEVGADAQSIEAAFSFLDRFQAKVSAALARFDAGGEWAADGSVSTIAWLRHHTGRTGGEAKRWLRRARKTEKVPVLDQAWRDGSLSTTQVDTVVANVPDRCEDLFAEHAPDVVPKLFELSAAHTRLAMRAWRLRAEALLDENEPTEAPSELYLSPSLDGRGQIAGYFAAEDHAIVDKAIGLAKTDDAEGEPARTAAQRRADALVDVCRWFLDHQHDHRGGRHRPHLNVVVDLDDLEAGRPGTLLDGTTLDGPTIQALACDSAFHRVLTRGRSTILDYGTATREIPAPLWAALVIRDQHCRHPGCDRPPDWCDGHHVWWASRDGPTRLDNLVLACRRHHRLWHRPKWRLKLLPDATLEITMPDGHVLTSEPPPQLHHLPFPRR